MKMDISVLFSVWPGSNRTSVGKLFLVLKVRIRTALLAATLAFATFVNAQNYDLDINVRKLQHGQGPYVSGVKVDIDNGSYMGFTDANGVAHIPQVPAGNHNIKISKPGYIRFNQSDYQLNSNTAFDACILPKTQIGPWGTNEFDVAKYKATYIISTGGWGNLDPPHWAQIAPIENRLNNATSADSILVQQAVDQIESMTAYNLITIGNYPEETSYTINMNQMTNFSQIGTDEFGMIFAGYSNITTTVEKKLVIHEIVKQFDMHSLSYYIYPSVMDPAIQTMTELQPWDANHIAVTFDEHYAKQRGEQDMFIGNMEENPAPIIPNATTITSPANNATNLATAVNTAWNNISGTDKYHVNIATNSNFANIVYDLLVLRKDTIINVNAGTTYYMRVRTENSAGNSSWSPSVMFTTATNAVGGTAITLPANGATNVISPTLYNWNPATNALQYNLEVSESSSFTTLVQDIIIPNATNTTLTLNGHRTFYNRVRGENGTILGAWSTTTTFSTLNHAPNPATNLTPTPANPQNATAPILFNWTAATDIDNDPLVNSLHIYNPQLDTTLTGIVANNYTLAANVLQPGSQYSYTIITSDGDLSATSAVQTLNTLAIVVGANTLTSPVNGATNVSTTTPFAWTAGTNANKYNLEVSLNNTFANLVYDVTVFDLDTVLTLNGHKQYFGRVRGENGSSVAPWSNVNAFNTINTAPTAPTNLTPTAQNPQNATQSIPFNWTASTDIDNDPITYTLHIFNGQLNQTYPNITTNNYILAANTLQPSSQYTYNVTANDGELNTQSLDQIVNTVAGAIGNNVITLPLDGAINQPTDVTYNWTQANNATKYNLEVALDNTFNNLVKDVIVYDLDTTLALNGNRTYFNRVRGETASDVGPWSPTTTFNTKNNLPQTPVIDSPLTGILVPSNYQNGQLILKYTTTATDIDNDPITTTVNVTGPGVNETFVTSIGGQITQGIDSTLFQYDKTYTATINATDNTDVVYGNDVTFKTLFSGLDDLISAKELKVYPNPSQGKVCIETSFKESMDIQVEVYDGSGRVLLKSSLKDVQNDFIPVDLSNFPGGMYIFKITTRGKYFLTKTQIVK